ncbi:MAG: prephenate dehydratase [Lachnospiraceae bacterium]|nr:prephenate dehydratase [Lachnospiraceae bacterium]
MSEKPAELKASRKKLDEIDEQIVTLFEKRMEISEDVARWKIANGMQVLDRKREKEKLHTLADLATSDFNRRGITELYEQIMAISRKRQYQMMDEAKALHNLPFIKVDHLVTEKTKVVYPGAAGSYSEAAMKQFFGRDIKNFSVASFRDAMTAIEEGAADYAVLPIENSTAGIVSQNYDLLNEFENYIVGEQIIPIRHCLMGVPGTTEDTIKTVYSHAQSLMQSDKFLEEHPSWQAVSMANNAFAAQKVAEDQDITEAAIASRYAAETYGLQIIKEGVNQAANNSTRFIICTNQKIFLEGAKKISLILEIEHESGSLYRILSHFIYNNLNMTKIESRPIEDRNFEYRFFIDFEGSLEDSAVRNALRGLRDETRYLKILGNY